MKDKIRVAFIYNKSDISLSGKHFNNVFYHFFMQALKRNKRLETTYYPSETNFDTSQLIGKTDLILLVGNQSWATPSLDGIEKLDIPVFCYAGDPHHNYKNSKSLHEKLKINHYFGAYASESFYKYFPKNFKYQTIIFGLESSLYSNVVPFTQRIKDRILNSGDTGFPDKISRIIYYYIRRRFNNYKFYKLRSKCLQLPYVDYTLPNKHEYVGDKYPLLLQKYSAAIAATTVFPTVKYLEIPAAGCLTFMEITNKNYGKYLGFRDGETAIFIDEKNYKKKFEEYLSDTNNPKWETIANQGREYVMTELNNDKAVDSLVQLIEHYF